MSRGWVRNNDELITTKGFVLDTTLRTSHKGTRMTKEEIIEMARQCGYKNPDAVGSCEDFAYFNLETFAKLVAEKEHEENAQIARLQLTICKTALLKV